ncbi:MAG: ATP synthase subunit I [Anaerovoracaceae bacterium]|jgi:hypothetical protein
MMINEKSKDALKEYEAFKNRIYKYTILIALIFQVVSLLILGWSIKFLGGLFIGTCISIINFQFLAWTCKKIVYGGKGSAVSIIGYFIRLLIYGASYYVCAKIDIIYCGFGCIAGFVTIKIAIVYLHAFKAGLDERKKHLAKVKGSAKEKAIVEEE